MDFNDHFAPAMAVTILLVLAAEYVLGINLSSYFGSYAVQPSALSGSYSSTQMVGFAWPIFAEWATCGDPGSNCFYD